MKIEIDKLASNISDKIGFEMIKDALIKPLESVKIKKQFTVPVPTKESKEKGSTPDESLTIKDYEKTKTEIREVDSNFAKGVILKLPIDLCSGDNKCVYKVGDTIVYNKRFAIEFDLFKNSVLVKPYDILAICKD